MKSCNTEKGKPKRKEFRFIKKKPKVAGEFFQIYKPLEPPPFFLIQCTFSARKDPQLTPSVAVSHRHSLTKK